MSKKVYCIAQFLPKPGQEQALFQVLQALEPNTLREDGCLQYRVTRHIASPFAEGRASPSCSTRFGKIWPLSKPTASARRSRLSSSVTVWRKMVWPPSGTSASIATNPNSTTPP